MALLDGHTATSESLKREGHFLRQLIDDRFRRTYSRFHTGGRSVVFGNVEFYTIVALKVGL